MDEPLKLSIITRTTGGVIASLLAAILLCSTIVVALLYDPPGVTWPTIAGSQSYSAPDVLAQRLVTGQAITTALAAAGDAFNVSGHDTLSLWLDYDQGDETGIVLTAYWLYSNATGSKEFQEADWSASAGERTPTANTYSVTTTALTFLTFDVTGVPYAKIYIQGTGTITTAGAITITYSGTAP